ncbi:hypothetical protein ES705_19459 [subsurface metagenome]
MKTLKEDNFIINLKIINYFIIIINNYLTFINYYINIINNNINNINMEVKNEENSDPLSRL